MTLTRGLRWIVWIYAAWTLFAVGYFFLEGSLTFGPKLKLDPADIVQVSGNGYRFKAPSPKKFGPDRWSEARVLQDGKELFPRVVAMQPVIEQGKGAYHFSTKNLWLSTPDGSDPRVNHRSYEVLFPLRLPSPPVWVFRCWAWGLILLCLALARRQLKAAVPLLRQFRTVQVALLVLALRMILISHDEIVATPTDQFEYLTLAKSWYYHAPPGQYFRLPVYPLFIALSGTTGLPLRLTIEWAQLAAYALLATGLVRCGVSRWAACGVFCWMALSPDTGGWNNYTISETFYVSMLMGAFGFGLHWIATGCRRDGLVCGVLLALLMNLREERIIGIALGGMLLCGAAAARWRATIDPRTSASPRLRRWRVTAIALVPMFISWMGCDLAFQGAFYLRTGVSSHCLLSTPGMLDFLDAMYRIPDQQPPRRCFWLNKSVRDYADSVSPAFHEWQHLFEEETIGFHERSEKLTGISDLMPDMFVFSIMWGNVGRGDLPVEYPKREQLIRREQQMKRIGQEIRQALQNHESQRIYMRGTYTVNSSVLTMWWHDLGPLLTTTLQWSFPPVMNGPYRPTGPTNAGMIQSFNEVAHRRPSLATLMDTTGDPRPSWIKSAWSLLHSVFQAVLWLAAAAAVLVPTVVCSRKAWRKSAAANFSPRTVAPLLILIMLAISRLAMGSLVPLFFIDNFERYMIVVPLVALPIFLLWIDLCLPRMASAEHS